MKQYNPDKPAYQTNFLLPDCVAKTHPGLSIIEVKTDPVDPALIIRQNELQRGADMMWWGMWVAIACAVAHGIVKSTAFRPFSKFLEWGVVGGILAIVGGMLYKNVVEYEKIIILTIAVGVGGYLLCRYKDWHPFSKANIKPRSGPQSDQPKVEHDTGNGKENGVHTANV